MRILIVSHYYPPEVGAPQARLSELANAWTQSGDDVTVLTGFPNHPTGRIHPGYEGRVRMEERIGGVRVVRTWLYATPNERILRKTLSHLSFMFSSVIAGTRRVGRPDVVIVSSPTFFSIFSAWLIARIKRARFVVEVRDLWPGFFVQLGVLRNRVVIKVLEAAELAAYRAADTVVTVTEGLRSDIVARRIPSEKVHVIRNGVDVDRFAEGVDDLVTWRKRLGSGEDETLVLYAGAHGISHALGSIADAADLLRDKPVHFAFVGDGAAKGALEQRVRELGLTNVSLLPSVVREEMPAVVAAADVCLVPLRDIPLFEGAIPSKMFEYMAAGKAIIGSLRGESEPILARAGAVVVPPENPQALATAIDELAGDADRRRRMGETARAFVRARFDRRALAREYRSLLGSAGR